MPWSNDCSINKNELYAAFDTDSLDSDLIDLEPLYGWLVVGGCGACLVAILGLVLLHDDL